MTTANRSLTRLSCRNTEEMWFDMMKSTFTLNFYINPRFDMMMSYGDLGPFLSIFSLISLVLYFVTSSDSGSLVIDCLASNGHPNPPRLQVCPARDIHFCLCSLNHTDDGICQRLLWAVTEGLTATALLVAGGKVDNNTLI